LFGTVTFIERRAMLPLLPEQGLPALLSCAPRRAAQAEAFAPLSGTAAFIERRAVRPSLPE
jgi:hypothetical protein